MPGLIKQILSFVGWSNGSGRVDDADDLVGLATNHFAEKFPNRSRDGCPAPGALSALISAGLLPSDELREHMLVCSECFAYYRGQLAHRRADKPVGATSAAFNTFRRRLAPMLAGSLAAVLAVFAFVVIYNRDQGIGQSANLNSTPSPVSAPIAAGEEWTPRLATPEPTAPQAPASSESSMPDDPKSSSSVIAENRVSIDLENYNPVRDAVPAQPPPVLLRTTGNELLIKLPAGSPQGSYTVNLINPYGRPLRSAKAISRDGAKLLIKLNLSSVKPGDYLICVTRETEVPQCAPTVVKPAANKK